MKITNKTNIKQIMKVRPDWNWKNLNKQGFYELMQSYRFSSIEESGKYFELVKSYIRWLIKNK